MAARLKETVAGGNRWETTESQINPAQISPLLRYLFVD